MDYNEDVGKVVGEERRMSKINGKDLFGCEEEVIQKKENIYIDDVQFSLASFSNNDNILMKDDFSFLN